MIDKHYKNFKVRDYMDDESLGEHISTNLLDCSLGTNPFLEEYIKKATSEINKYPSIKYELLKKELLKFWGKYICNDITKENIAFGNGTMGLLRNLSEFLIQEGTRVLGCAPQFPRFISEVELKRGIYEGYNFKKEENYKFIVAEFIKKMNNNYDIISIENPNNPTGQIIAIEDIEKVVKKAKENDSIVIVDEAYGDYMQNYNSAIKLVNEYDNVVVLRSASKFYGLPNHRIGYMFASKELVKMYNEISIPFPFSDLSASIFIKVLKDYKKFEDTKLKTIKVNKEIYKILEKEDYLYTSVETPIFTIKSNKYTDLSKKLIDEGIIAESGINFMNLDSTYARIRINPNYKKLIEILLKIKT